MTQATPLNNKTTNVDPAKPDSSNSTKPRKTL